MDNHISEALMLRLKSRKAMNRWVLTTHSALRSKTFAAAMQAAGSYDALVLWLAQAAPSSPKDARNIRRFSVTGKKNQGGNVRTTISLDHEMHRALVEHLGTGELAIQWIRKTALSLEPTDTGLSRAVQAEIMRLIVPSKAVAPPT